MSFIAPKSEIGRIMLLFVLLIISLLSFYFLSDRSYFIIKSINDIFYPSTSNTNLNSIEAVCTPLSQELNSDPQYKCAIITNYSIRIECYRKLGIEPSPECENITSLTQRIDCYNNVSRIEKNPDLCDTLWGDERKECRGGCALNLLRPQECEVWGNNSYKKYLCYGKAAAENINLSLCDKIPSYGRVNDDGGYAILTNQLKDMCFAGFALYTSNISACDNVIEHDIRLYCMALILNDTKICSQMKDAFHVEKCASDTYMVDMTRRTSPRNPMYPDRPNRLYWVIYTPASYENKTRLW